MSVAVACDGVRRRVAQQAEAAGVTEGGGGDPGADGGARRRISQAEAGNDCR